MKNHNLKNIEDEQKHHLKMYKKYLEETKTCEDCLKEDSCCSYHFDILNELAEDLY